jgi:sugar lactone lactonase YvrE
MGYTGNGDDNFDIPSGIACDRNGNLYIADRNNHRIKKYSSDGDLIGWWGSYDIGAQSFWLAPGSLKTGAQSDADGGFDTPVDVAVDSEGHVFVADSGNFRIQRFASEQEDQDSAGFQNEIYLGETLSAIGVDEWATVYSIIQSGVIRCFAPDP